MPTAKSWIIVSLEKGFAIAKHYSRECVTQSDRGSFLHSRERSCMYKVQNLKSQKFFTFFTNVGGSLQAICYSTPRSS